MKRIILTLPLLLTANLFLDVMIPARAEEMHLVHDGKPIEKNIRQTEMDSKVNPFWTDWTQRKGETVDGLFVFDRRNKNLKDFAAV